MQFPPITLTEITMLLAIGAAILLTMAEFSSVYLLGNMIFNKKRLQNVAVATTFLFLATVTIILLNILAA
jgi:hypothetical protein